MLSLSTISTRTNFNNLKECIEHPWKTKDDEENDESCQAFIHF
jgi:hypothetical protein